MAGHPKKTIHNLDNLSMMIFYLVPSGQARKAVPAPLKVAEVLPGMTMGGLYAARYGASGKESVNEFGVLRAYVSHYDKKGFFISEFRSHDARKGCSDAEFSWVSEGGAVSLTVSSGGQSLISIKMRPTPIEVPVKSNFPFVCIKEGGSIFFQNHYVSKLGVSRTTVKIPDGSPLKGIPLGVKLMSAYWDASNIVMMEQEYAPKRGIKAVDNALGTPMGRLHKLK